MKDYEKVITEDDWAPHLHHVDFAPMGGVPAFKCALAALLRREVAEAVEDHSALLRDLEWSHSDDVSDDHCPRCMGQKPSTFDHNAEMRESLGLKPSAFQRGHKPKCRLLDLIRARAAQDPA